MTDAFRLIVGDVRLRIKNLPDASVDCVITSPPYWSKRDYKAKGQLGLETTPQQYVSALVRVLREVRRVLKPTGTLWLNVGDSHVAGRNGGFGDKSNLTSLRNHRAAREAWMKTPTRTHLNVAGLRPKSLIGIPWLVAFGLQQDGWTLRSEIIWDKPSPMPESVTDRPTRAHENIFLFAQARHYYYDAAAIAEPICKDTERRVLKGERKHAKNGSMMRNARSVWRIPQTPEPEAHTATFPHELVRRMLLAGCPPDGVVLDPFAGLATTGVVAIAHGRKFIGIEINAEFAEIGQRRLVEAATAKSNADAQLLLFGAADDGKRL